MQRPWDGPLFVVGVPRSGTSLLYALLNQHPEIALMYEADLPLLWPLFLTGRSKSQWLRRWNFWNGAPERHQIDVSRIPSDISDMKSATVAAYREYAGHKSAAIWGCKSPNQYDSLVRVAEYFPTARFVIIWRDPADVCRSMIRARKDSPRFKQRGLTHRALLGCYQMGMERNRLLRRGVRVHEIQYEDLIGNPTEEMMKVCRFLGIPFDSNMVSLKNADRSAVMPGGHNALVNGESIVAPRKQTEVLPWKFKRKVERYKQLWRQKRADWALRMPVEEGDVTTPTLSERLADEILYRLLRSWDLFVVFVYCFAPLWLLKSYRAWNGRPYLTWEDYARKCTEPNRS